MDVTKYLAFFGESWVMNGSFLSLDGSIHVRAKEKSAGSWTRRPLFPPGVAAFCDARFWALDKAIGLEPLSRPSALNRENMKLP